jgi:hypothetical protein
VNEDTNVNRKSIDWNVYKSILFIIVSEAIKNCNLDSTITIHVEQVESTNSDSSLESAAVGSTYMQTIVTDSGQGMNT